MFTFKYGCTLCSSRQDNSRYVVTFTGYWWLPLFEKANASGAVYKCLSERSSGRKAGYLYGKSVFVSGYVIMPWATCAALLSPYTMIAPYG
jgi:hypothetical protein